MPAQNGGVNIRYFADASNLKLSVQQGDVNVPFRSLSATDIEDLRSNDKVKIETGPGGEIRYIVFNFHTKPFGEKQADADPEKALAKAGVTGLVDMKLRYSPGHYGPSSGDEYAMIKTQLEKDGLFTVGLQSTEWVQYLKDRSADVYPPYQLGWFPDYSDADTYLAPSS
ncbi:ABC transporter substrate-binding protein [Boudabousia marimammalium]|uniref:Solute-binding protein family 5 domain-containing protein n=1 Tax=Boudabousia marimammalium TaxID=156892 RepID=A0A1Q5PRT8_9ACTO|nr:ABC transporter substrate-binding protein [Boudabousia marimammalium]OKL50291.1 hypothetical protein BM477_02570 [Boudabousia marimammalium]